MKILRASSESRLRLLGGVAHGQRPTLLWSCPVPGVCKGEEKGYKDVVVHVSLLQVLYNGGLCDLGEQHHVIHTAMLDIVTLPVVSVGAFAALETKA